MRYLMQLLHLHAVAVVNALPLPSTNEVAVKAPVAELNDRFVPLFARLPVALVTNTGKQVVSEDSSATLTKEDTPVTVAVMLVTERVSVLGLYWIPASVLSASAVALPLFASTNVRKKFASVPSVTVLTVLAAVARSAVDLHYQ